MLDWNDYHFVLTIARNQSLYRAARDLNVAVSTVMRHLAQIEARAGIPIFQKTEAGQVPTAAGEILVAKAKEIETLAQEADVSLRSEISARENTLRISASEVIAPFFVAKHLPAIQQACPAHKVTLTVTDQSPSHGTEGFDISLWPSTPSNEDLFGRKLTKMKWAMFGASIKEDYTSAKGVEPGVSVMLTGAENTPMQQMEDSAASVATNSLIAAAAIASIAGNSAFLPCILGGRCPDLEQLSTARDHKIGQLWAIYRKDAAQISQIRRVVDVLATAASQDKGLFLGVR